MFRLKKIMGLAAAAVLVSAVSASAAVVTTTLLQGPASNSNITPSEGIVAPGYGAILPPGATGSSNIVDVDPPTRPSNVCLSPYATRGQSYLCVTPSLTGNTGTINFTPGQTSLTMLWGSIDTYNRIDFLNSGNVIGSVGGQTAANIANGSALDCGSNGNCNIAAIFRFTLAGTNTDPDGTFDQVKIFTTKAAAEVAFIPLPAAAWLLLAGIGGLGLMSRRRKAA